VEEASVEDLYATPAHPYTIGLLGSLPRLDMLREERLTSIDGMPPDLIALPEGCPFAARCGYVIDRCPTEKPPLETVAVRHKVACWIDLSTGRER
jgi:oligopeptide transport system ATP-binding protein